MTAQITELAGAVENVLVGWVLVGWGPVAVGPGAGTAPVRSP